MKMKIMVVAKNKTNALMLNLFRLIRLEICI